jgi:predicted PurR-regulated permease PerM
MTVKKEWLFNLLFLALTVLAFYLFYRIVAPYLNTLAWAVILTIVAYPLYKLINRKLQNRRNLASGITTGIVIVAIVFPAAALLNMLAGQVFDVYAYCENFVREGGHVELLNKLAAIPVIGDLVDRYVDIEKLDLNSLLLDNLRRLSLYVAGHASKIIQRFSAVVFQFFLMTVAVFFLFRDGEGVLERIKGLMPFSASERQCCSPC